MADVSISYKGNEIASMNATGVKTLLTSSAFCEDDITVTYTKPAAPTPTLQTKSVTYTPTTSQQTDSITADAGYDALGEVNVTVDAMPSGTAGTPTATKGTVSGNSVSVTPSVTNTTGYITGSTKTGTPVTVSASELVSGTKTITGSGTTDVTNYASASVSAGSATTPATTITANPSISVSSGGLITASVSESQSVTPTVSAGYVSSGTAGTVSVSGSNTSQLTTQAAQTIHPSTTDQTIASGKYLTGAQTVKGVLLTNLSADNIKKDVVVKVGDSTDDDCVTSVTGTYEGGGGGLQIYSSTLNAGIIPLPQGVTLADMTANVKAITMTNALIRFNGIDDVPIPRLGGTYDSNQQSLFFGGLIYTSNDTYMFAISTASYSAGSFFIDDFIAYSVNESDFVLLDIQEVDSVDFIK